MNHLRTISKHVPAKAESLLVTQQKVAILGAFGTALNGLLTALEHLFNFNKPENE